MNTDENKTESRKLTPEEVARFTALRDERTVFELAILAMEIHTGTLLKNKNKVANAFLKMTVVLSRNPGFAERFKAAQQAVIDQIEAIDKPSVIAPSPQVVVKTAAGKIDSPLDSRDSR